MRRTIASSAVLLFLVCSPASFSQNVQETLRKTREAYARLRSYDFEGATLMTVEVDGVRYRMNLPLEIAQGDNPDQRMSVQYGKSAWEKPVGNAAKSKPPDSFNMPSGQFFDFARLLQKVNSTKFLGEKVLKVAGRKRSCHVIEVVHERKRPASNEVVLVPETIWIDMATYLVLRVAFQTIIPPENSQPARQLNWITTFTSYRLNGDPPQWLVDIKAINEKKNAALSATKIGTEAPDFKLQDLEGREVSLADLHDKVVLLDFWATWCFPCREELPVVAKIERAWAAKGLMVLRITNEMPVVVRAFLKDTGQKYSTLVDGANVSRQYGVDGIPTLVLIDKAGKIVAYDVSTLKEAELVDRLKKAGLQ